MEVQTDFGARGRVPEMLCYSVDGLLSAEFNPSLIQHADICLTVIEQRFVSAHAWLRVGSMSFNASTPQDIASALLERASAATSRKRELEAAEIHDLAGNEIAAR